MGEYLNANYCEAHFIRTAQPARRRQGGAGMVEDEMGRAAFEPREEDNLTQN